MKRFTLFVGILALCLSMSACDSGTYRMGEDLNSENVVAIALIQYENPGQRTFASWVPDHTGRHGDLDLSCVSVLETLEGNQQASFLAQLSQQEILMGYDGFDSPKGICIRITYYNGDFLIVNTDHDNQSFRGYIGVFNEEGKLLDFIGTFASYRSFESLVNDYFEYKV